MLYEGCGFFSSVMLKWNRERRTEAGGEPAGKDQDKTGKERRQHWIIKNMVAIDRRIGQMDEAGLRMWLHNYVRQRTEEGREDFLKSLEISCDQQDEMDMKKLKSWLKDMREEIVFPRSPQPQRPRLYSILVLINT